MLDEDTYNRFAESPVMKTLSLINSKWKVIIMWSLLDGKKRFGELRRQLGVSQKVLTQQLREMEADGLVNRIAYSEIPPRVEYELTELGLSLRPVGKALWDWGVYYMSLRKGD